MNVRVQGIIGWLVVVGLFAAAAFLFFSRLGPSGHVSGLAEQSVTGRIRVGAAAPNVRFVGLNGQEMTITQYKGHPLWLNFFATWCVPCKSEMPQIQRYYDKNKSKGLIVLGIDQQEEAHTVKAFAQGLKLKLPLFLDGGDGTLAYDVSSIPKSVFVDKEGVVREIYVGQMTKAAMREALAKILGDGIIEPD